MSERPNMPTRRLRLLLGVEAFIARDETPESCAHKLLSAFDEYDPSAKVIEAEWEQEWEGAHG